MGAWGFTTSAAVGHRQILNKKNQPIKVGFFLIIFRLRFLHPALRQSLRAFVTRKVHFASLRDRFSSYSHASAAEEQHQTLNKKKTHQKGGVSVSSYLQFKSLAPGPAAEPSGIQNSQSTLCVAARPSLILLPRFGGRRTTSNFE